ncbi:apolipoprotein D-like [Episyrphus balteatus]|uniref:apolipoprotein D-like n=1 Tax=Episyrphus balteatus TaxID=286459 RepID=UPI00248513FB|nr:apolipoprotein D-like [Episyrphus balteatus]
MIATKSILVIVAVSLFGLVAGCQAQVQAQGACPNVTLIPNFNATAYMGLWYESAKYPAIFETGGSCVTAKYTLLPNGTVAVENSQYNKYTHSPLTIKGNAVVVGNAKLLVNFPSVPGGAKTGSNYWVLHTDYVNYSVVFSCSQKSSTSHTEILWILTRAKSPSVQTILDAVKVITKNKLSVDNLRVTAQDNC